MALGQDWARSSFNLFKCFHRGVKGQIHWGKVQIYVFRHLQYYYVSKYLYILYIFIQCVHKIMCLHINLSAVSILAGIFYILKQMS